MRIAVLAILLLAPPVLLAILAVPRLETGLKLPQVQRVVIDRYLALAIARPRLDQAQSALNDVMPEDGENRLWRAEFLAVLAGHDRQRLEAARALTIDGLAVQPANPRGWTLLCELDVALGRHDAAQCMDTAFFIGPFDWFVSHRRTALSVFLWPQLDGDTRDAAARRLRLIWNTPGLHWVDLDVARTANGQIMLEQAFADDPASYVILERQAGVAR